MIEKIPHELSKEIHEMAEDLKREGYEFELEETSDEFIIKLSGEHEFHLAKIDPFPYAEGLPERSLEEAIRDRIIESAEKNM